MQWISDTRFMVDGVTFTLDYMQGGSPRPSTVDDFTMMKTPQFLRQYSALDGMKHVLELGVYQGGSLVFFDRIFKPERISAVELSPGPLPALDRYVAANADRIRVHYQTSQGDVAALERIVREDFGGRLDLVVDDASHFYELTKISFRTLFPHVAPGGVYIIEDWNWGFHQAYQDPTHAWFHEPALANILIDLGEEVTLNNSIESMTVLEDMIVIRKKPVESIGPVFQGRGLRGRERVLL